MRAGLIGAGKFGSMFLAQVPSIKGLDVAVIADLDPERARARPARRSAGTKRASRARNLPTTAAPRSPTSASTWSSKRPAARMPASPMRSRRSTPSKSIVMVNVEADALAGRAAGPQGARGRRGLFHGLWRSAGADCRNGRLGAQRRLYRRRGRQRHQISAGLSQRHAGRRVGALRPHRRRRPAPPA